MTSPNGIFIEPSPKIPKASVGTIWTRFCTLKTNTVIISRGRNRISKAATILEKAVPVIVMANRVTAVTRIQPAIRLNKNAARERRFTDTKAEPIKHIVTEVRLHSRIEPMIQVRELNKYEPNIVSRR